MFLGLGDSVIPFVAAFNTTIKSFTPGGAGSARITSNLLIKYFGRLAKDATEQPKSLDIPASVFATICDDVALACKDLREYWQEYLRKWELGIKNLINSKIIS